MLSNVMERKTGVNKYKEKDNSSSLSGRTADSQMSVFGGGYQLRYTIFVLQF